MSKANRGRYAPTPPPPFTGRTIDDGEYAYAWNLPDYDVAVVHNAPSEPGITAPDTTGENLTRLAGIDYLSPDGTRKALSHDDLFELCPPQPGLVEAGKIKQQRREAYLRRRLQKLPAFIRRRYSTQLEALDQQDPAGAVKWLFGTFERHVLRRVDAVDVQYLPRESLPAILLPFKDDFHLLPWADKKRLKRLAYKLASIMKSEFMREFDFQYAQTTDPEFSTLYAYGYIASKANVLNIPIPGWKQYCKEELEAEDALRAIARLQAEKWWLNKLRTIHDRWREHLMIAAGYVSKVASPKCSEPCLKEWLAQRKSNFEYLQAMELEDQDTGERTSLLDKVLASSANPKIARHELVVRTRGFEEIANEMGLVGVFYTLTAPSSFHSIHIHNGRRNDKYNGASPRQTQKYLCNVWSRVRAAWLRRGIRTFGIRTAEPHHDATPHWHLVLFFRPEELEWATDIFRHYALQMDGTEPGAQERRFEFELIDKKRGGATAYVIKYISKNIDGYGMDGELDHDTGKPIKEEAKRVKAWASRWKIRQFQQLGGAPVTIWRELRRLREPVANPDIEPARVAADESKWQGYVTAQGGPFVARDSLRVRLTYEVTEDGNDYGDTVTRVKGIFCPLAGSESTILTRTRNYKIVPKRKPAPVVDPLTLPGRPATPWSSVNNCTRDPLAGTQAGNETGDGPYCPVDLSNITKQERREISQRIRDEIRKPPKRESIGEKLAASSTGSRRDHALINAFATAAGLVLEPWEVESLLRGATLNIGASEAVRLRNGRIEPVSASRSPFW
ncbi:replication endonuclease [Enterobacter asburiae]|uniref:replication endonuclease n=2 Tax=Enterobacteriaceae TaxID=543 RepID=UPI0021D3971B|nr:replication endonuclease [Enterobacter asburiae]MCU6243858.1 replication endonuclease [Enterobacter asburiae]